jgi:hypothetical protein
MKIILTSEINVNSNKLAETDNMFLVKYRIIAEIIETIVIIMLKSVQLRARIKAFTDG